MRLLFFCPIDCATLRLGAGQITALLQWYMKKFCIVIEIYGLLIQIEKLIQLCFGIKSEGMGKNL